MSMRPWAAFDRLTSERELPTSPSRLRPRPSSQAGSAANLRPIRKAWVFDSTETPFSSMARSIASAEMGRTPCW